MSGPDAQSGASALARAVAQLRYEDLPDAVVERTEDLFLDWLASAIAGASERPVRSLAAFAESMGPADGPCELTGAAHGTSPYFAALVNGAASHSIEQDDLHNASVFHPGAVVFAPVLAVAQATGLGGRELIVAAVAGYEVGVRVARFLGASHYRVFHTTGTAGTLAAAAAAGKLLGLDEDQLTYAIGTAGTQAAGLWEFLADGADSKPLHAGKAGADGVLSAYSARSGMTGAQTILEGPRGMAAGMLGRGDALELERPWSEPWAVTETSIKHHASCRHTHPAADALLAVIAEHELSAGQIVRVRARVHAAAIDVCGSTDAPVTPHQAKFSMAFVLALIAVRGHARVDDFDDDSLRDEALLRFAGRVVCELDETVEDAYPERWIGVVNVELDDGRSLSARVDDPRGDPGNPLTRADVAEKFAALAQWSGALSAAHVDRTVARVARLRDETDLLGLLNEGR